MAGSGEELTTSGYIGHHLQNLTFGKHPDGTWGFAHGAEEAAAMEQLIEFMGVRALQRLELRRLGYDRGGGQGLVVGLQHELLLLVLQRQVDADRNLVHAHVGDGDYVVTADQAGDYLVGPFVIKQGAKEARIREVPMTFEAVPEDPDMRVRLILPEGNVYPDQRVPVKIEWWDPGV